MYDVAEDGKTTTQLRAHVRRLAKEVEDLKSVVSLLAMAPDRAQAATWASELEKNGFAHHSVDEIKKSLQVSFPSFTLLPLLTPHRIHQRHGLLFLTKIRLVHREVSSFQTMAIALYRRTTAPRVKKGEVSERKPVGRG